MPGMRGSEPFELLLSIPRCQCSCLQFAESAARQLTAIVFSEWHTFQLSSHGGAAGKLHASVQNLGWLGLHSGLSPCGAGVRAAVGQQQAADRLLRAGYQHPRLPLPGRQPGEPQQMTADKCGAMLPLFSGILTVQPGEQDLLYASCIHTHHDQRQVSCMHYCTVCTATPGFNPSPKPPAGQPPGAVFAAWRQAVS